MDAQALVIAKNFYAAEGGISGYTFRNELEALMAKSGIELSYTDWDELEKAITSPVFDFVAEKAVPLAHGPEGAPKHTAIPCRALSLILGLFDDAALVYHRATGNVTLETSSRIDYVELERTSVTGLTELRTEKGLRWYVPAEAWEAIQKANGA